MTSRDQQRAHVLTRLVAGELEVGEAALLMGLSERQAWRLRRAFLERGPAGLVHGNRGRASPRRLGETARPGAGYRHGDTPAFFDPGCCAKITRMLVVSFRHLAFAPPPPQNVGLGGCGTPDARLFWMLPDDPRITGVVIYHRRADTVQWQQTRAFPKSESQVIPGLGTDSDVFAVATLDAQGDESLPVSPRSVAF